MKKLFTTIIVLLLTLSVNVYAEDYNILVDENNNFTLKDSSNNPVTDNSIAKYENSVLTLGENTTFNEIKSKHDLTITSNNKEVSIKNLTTKEGNTYLPVNVNINKLKVKDDDTYIFQIDVGGNLVINNSNTNSKYDTEVKGFISIENSNVKTTKSINSRSSDNDGYGIIIKSSEITSDSQVRPANGGSYFKDSKLDVKYVYSMGHFVVDNCEINTSYFTENKTGEYNFLIKNSTIKDDGQFYILVTGIDNTISIENSTIECGSFFGVSRYNYAGDIPAKLHIDNSNITVKNDMRNDGEYILIENSDLTVGGISGYKKTIIKNSKINTKNNWIHSDKAEIYNSELSLDSWMQVKKLIVENSTIRADYFYFEKDTSTTEEYDTIIKNSKITTDKHRNTIYNILIDNSEFNILKGINVKGNIKFTNSTGQINEETTIKDNLILEDSILKLKNEQEDKTALFVGNDLNIKNSNIVIDNNSTGKVAAIVKNNVVLDDKIVPIDDSKTILKTKELTKQELVELLPSYESVIEDGTNAKIFTYSDDNFSKYVQLATTKTINFRVKNGTWLDGTKDDIKLDYLYGEKIEVDSLPEEVKKLLTSKMGEWSVDLNNIDPTKDQEIEFRYNIINPETARNYIIMILAILAVTILLKRQISIRKGLVN